MLPSIPRVPMFGGKMAARKKLEFPPLDKSKKQDRTAPTGNDDYRIRQLMHGGPVQRALKADLSLLRTEFKTDFDRFCSVEDGLEDEDKSQGNDGFEGKYYSAGTIFKVFKDTFKRTKFGIIQSRCCPPRSDEEAYCQMVYSSALDILKNSFEDEDSEVVINTGVNLPPVGGRDSDKSIFDAVFAIFVLYTLYETNPLPDLKFTDGVENDPSLKLLSALPMGVSSELTGRRAIRRSFRAPIRISQHQFSMLYKLRDLALASMDSCVQRHLSGLGCKPLFGLAKDCIHVIDRLFPSLQLCEYSGPCSLEGLTGSATYYHTVALEEGKSKIAESDSESCLERLLEDEENLGDDQEVFCGDLDIYQFEKSIQSCQQRYHDVLGKIAMDLARNNTMPRPSRQLQSILKIMEPVIDRRRVQREARTANFLHEVKTSLSGQQLINEGNDRNEKANEEGHGEGESSETATTVQLSNQEATVQREIKVCYPASFGKGLKVGIERAIKILLEHAKGTDTTKKVGTSAKKKTKPAARVEREQTCDFEDWLFDDLFTEFSNGSEDLGEEDIDFELDNFSIADSEPLQGANALQQLLSFAKQNNGSRKSDSDSDASYEYSDDDESAQSFSTGQGNRALQTLLTSAIVRGAKKRNRISPRGDAATFKCMSTKSIQSNSTYGFKSTEGSGQNALQALLSQAQSPPPRKKRCPARKTAQVSKEKKRTHAQTKDRNVPTLKNTPQSKDVVHDDLSVKSFNTMSTLGGAAGSGQNALQALLRQAQSSPPKKKRAPARNAVQVSREQRQTRAQTKGSSAPVPNNIQKEKSLKKSLNDGLSVRSTNSMSTFGAMAGNGEKALEDLLSQARSSRSKKKRAPSRKTTQISREERERCVQTKGRSAPTSYNTTKKSLKQVANDDLSARSTNTISTFGAVAGDGKNALEALLDQVQPSPSKNKKTLAQKTAQVSNGQQKTSVQTKGRNAPISNDSRKSKSSKQVANDDMSVRSTNTMSTFGAVAGSGQTALQSLLLKASQPPSKRLTSDASHSKWTEGKPPEHESSLGPEESDEEESDDWSD